MPTQMNDEFGLGPVLYRLRRHLANIFTRLGWTPRGESSKMLDPMTVNYAVWDEVRRCIRRWPKYKEAPNTIEIYVSVADWEDYWGADTARKEAGVADYVVARTHEKSIWMAGMPQVKIMDGDDIKIGGIEVTCRFEQPKELPGAEESPKPMPRNLGQNTVRFEKPKADELEPTISREAKSEQVAPETKVSRHLRRKAEGAASDDAKASAEAPEMEADTKPVPPWIAETADKPAVGDVTKQQAQHSCAWLTDAGGFRLKVSPSDVIGVVGEDIEVDEDVNLRLDAEGFPYVEAKQCSFEVIEGRWHLKNYGTHGTKIVTASGMRLMLAEPEPYPLEEGDTIYLGPTRPLTFTFTE